MYIEPPLTVAAVESTLLARAKLVPVLLIAQKLSLALYEPPAEAATTVTVIAEKSSCRSIYGRNCAILIAKQTDCICTS